jgi:hypothetical protein
MRRPPAHRNAPPIGCVVLFGVAAVIIAIIILAHTL